MKKSVYLFVCMANMQRSPTAETVCKGLARESNLPVECVSAGLSPMAVQPVNKDLVQKADLIFVMEHFMKEVIMRDYDVEAGRILVFNIPDVYEQDDPVLVKQLRDAMEPYFRKGAEGS